MTASPNPRSLEPHIRAGHCLMPLRKGTKAPADKNWLRKPYAAFDPRAHMEAGGNVGVRLTAEQLVVDIDPRNMPDGRDTFAEMCAALSLDPSGWPCVHTGGGGGGRHYYLRKSSDTPVRAKLEAFPGVDFKTLGGQVVAAGSLHPDTRLLYKWDPFEDAAEQAPAAPAALLGAVRKQAGEGRGWRGGERLRAGAVGLDAGGPRPGELPRQRQLAGVDDGLPPRHRRCRAGGVRGLVRARSRLRRRRRAGPRALGQPQRRPGRRARVTYKTLHKLLRDAGHEDLMPRVAAADDFLDDLPAEETASAPAARRLAGLRDWVWVVDATKFVRRADTKRFKPDQWNSLHADLADGNLLNHVWKGKTPVRRFESLVFIPGQPEELDGGRYNIWWPSGVEARRGDTSALERHMDLLLPDATERGYLLDYLHFLVVRPEVKIHFALLLQGEQGTGKSAIGKLLARTIGERNVVVPSNAEVNSNWTAWQEGAQLAIVEELMTSGRLELANRLKPVITDEKLRIEDKHQPLYSIPNHLNLLCFTNHEDAVRLEKGDRRWLVLFSPMQPQPEEYYDRLFAWIESDDGAAAFRHMLEQRVPALNPKGRAPSTGGKAEMREASLSQLEAEVKEWADGGGGPFRQDLFRMKDVTAVLSREARGSTRNLNAAVSKALKELGAVRHTRNTNDDGLPVLTLYSIRDHVRWTAEGPVERARAYLKMRGLTPEEFAMTEG